MSILVDENTRVIVHGITGRVGAFQAKTMNYGKARVVAGVVPGKGGQNLDGIPIFDTAKEARSETGGNTSVIFVPKQFALQAVLDALEAELSLIVCVPEGVPVHDVLKMKDRQRRGRSILIGPNSPGVISPGKAKAGGMSDKIYMPGSIGIISRSGTLSYETVNLLTQSGLGQSTVVGIGGDMIPCFDFVEALELFEKDKETKLIVVIGEIGGTGEIEAAKHIKKRIRKPLFALIVGASAPPGKKMGHAGAIVSGEKTTAAAKIEALRNAGVRVVENPFELRDVLASALWS
jgi:succinyl-CoA synthetase alpha subunit